jgi:glycine cleavage system aminomethyltransferase T
MGMASPSTPTARTPLHHWHAAHGARFADRDGWQVVAAYSTPEGEAAAARRGLAIADVSAFAKVSLSGAGLSAAADYLLGAGRADQPNTAASLLLCGPGLACRLTTDHLLLLPSTTNAAPLAEALVHLRHDQALLQTDVTSAQAGLWVVGPHTDALLSRLTHLDVPSLPSSHACAETDLAGVHGLLVRSTELVVPSVRLYVSWDLGEFVWERLLEAGRSFGILPLGLAGLAALRMPV